MTPPLDERLERALAPHAAAAEPTDARWADIAARAQRMRRRDRSRRAVVVLAAAALVIGALALVRLDRGPGPDGTVTAGDPPATVDPKLLDLARASVELAAALADEARAALVAPSEVAAARAATDTAAAAWRRSADRRPARDEDARETDQVVVQRLASLMTNRVSQDQHASTPTRNAINLGYASQAVASVLGTRASEASSVGGARELADAGAITTMAVETPMLAAPAVTPPGPLPSPDPGGLTAGTSPPGILDRHRGLAGGLAPARRGAVQEVLSDRRLVDAATTRAADLTAGRDPSVPDDVVVALAAERQQRLIALALAALAEQPAAPSPLDPAAVHAVVRDETALRAARDGELWATLVGDGGPLAEARSRADAVLAAARRSRAAAGVDAAAVRRAEEVEATVDDIRRAHDAGSELPSASARRLAAVRDGEVQMLVAALDSGPVVDWRRTAGLVALGEYATCITHAAGLALRRVPGAPAPTGGVDVAELRALRQACADAINRFQEGSTPDLRARFRADGDDSYAMALIQRAVEDAPPAGDGRPWPEQVSRVRAGLDRLAGLVADIAG
jgi:hypothetical protein